MEGQNRSLLKEKTRNGAVNSPKRRVAVYGWTTGEHGGAEMLRAYYAAAVHGTDDQILTDIFLDECPANVPVECRPAFRKLRQKCRKGEVDIILVRSVSHLARNISECLRCVRVLRELGVELCFEQENISTLSAEVDLNTQLFAWIAETEVRKLENRPFGWPAGKKVFRERRAHT